MFEEARRLARSLRKPEDWEACCGYLKDKPEDWKGDFDYLKHKATGWSLWIGDGLFFIQPYRDGIFTRRAWQQALPKRYGLIEKLIIWYGGARRWHRILVRENKRQARFEGDA